MTPEPTYSRNPDVVYRSIEGGGVLLNTKTGSYHEVNSTAREIWEALEAPSSAKDLVQRLAERFGDAPDLDADVNEFVAQLAERDLIVVSDQ